MRTLSISVLLLLAFALTSARNWRHNSRWIQPPCCVTSTTIDISQDVVLNTYREPHVTHPCVKAFVLTTDKGPICVDPNAAWVKEIIADMKKV